MTSEPTQITDGADHVTLRGVDGTPRVNRIDPDRDRCHAVVISETRRLERVLRVFGPMRRDALADAVRAQRWRDGTFQEAVRGGLRRGTLSRLPLGWLKATRR